MDKIENHSESDHWEMEKFHRCIKARMNAASATVAGKQRPFILHSGPQKMIIKTHITFTAIPPCSHATRLTLITNLLPSRDTCSKESNSAYSSNSWS
mmetsp:Transcript_7025/g.26306  ORF Transcript_7025/g.26306 Transcript_7025/m.26306 type:complete len:97 (-) Transcript_7025:5847-6137(-)